MKKRFKVLGALAVLLLNILISGAIVLGEEADLLQTNYYVISIGEPKGSLDLLIQTAQGDQFTVIVISGETATSYRGSEATEEPEAVLLDADSLLYVDQSLFLLQIAGEDLDYVVRPTEGGYALLLIPHRDLPQGETLISVLNELQQMGIVGEEVQMEWVDAFPKKADKAPKPPEGVAIDSDLYGLAVAADWFSTAASRGLTRVGLRVEVVAEKLPGETIPAAYQSYIVSETEELAKLLVPIHRLVGLAKSSAIGYVRPPYQPHPATP